MSDDVTAAWTGLLDALREAGYAAGELVRAGASAEALAAAEAAIGRALPSDLAALYALSDGQVDWYGLTHGDGGRKDRVRGEWVGSMFGDGWTFAPLAGLVADWTTWKSVRDGYTAQELADDFDSAVEVRGDDPVQAVYTCADWIGFAIDGGGNALAVDLAPTAGGTVGQVIVIGSDEDLRRVVAPGIVALLHLCAERVASGDAEDVDDGVRLYPLEA